MNRKQRRRTKTTRTPPHGHAAVSDEARKLLESAVVHSKAGRFAEAEAACRRALSSLPKQPVALNLLGNILSATGRFDEAVTCQRKAIQSKPDYSKAHNDLGRALRAKGDLAASIESYKQALRFDPNSAPAHFNLGVALQGQSKLREAVESYKRAIEVRADHADAHDNLGAVLLSLDRLDEAVGALQRAIELAPGLPAAYINLAHVFVRQGKYPDAAVLCRKAIELKPDSAFAYNNLGYALQRQDLSDDAYAAFRRAIALDPKFVDAHNNLGNALHYMARFDEANDAYRKAIELDPQYARAHYNLAMNLVRLGEFREGFEEYEWRWKVPHWTTDWRDLPQPLWDGGPLDGRKILLHAEQGLGDTIHFIRYAPLVVKRGGCVLVECPPSLSRMVETVPGVSQVISRIGDLPEFDCWTPLLSLPRLFGTTMETIPVHVPYMSVPRDVESPALDAGESDFKVGIVWSGRATYDDNRWRSCALADVEPLRHIEGVALFSLQVGPQTAELKTLPPGPEIRDLSGALTDLAVTAKVMSELDLVITVDTSVAHLAGALALPVWVFLAYVPDWRWHGEGADSPWYPTMRLFRQEKWGDWAGVFRRIEAALRERISA